MSTVILGMLVDQMQCYVLKYNLEPHLVSNNCAVLYEAVYLALGAHAQRGL